MRKRFFLILFFFLFLPAVPPAAGTEEDKPTVGGITLMASGGKLLLFAAVKNCFTKEMLEGVHNGIPVTFRFKIRLERLRSWWLNQTVSSLGINHTLSYDPIRRDYQVAFSEYEQPRATRSLAEAERMMAELNKIELARLNQLPAGEKYALRIKATLVENTLPLSIHSLIPFYSIWNFETDWRLVDFSY